MAALPPDTEARERVTVPLFTSSHGGYGNELEAQDFRYHRVHGSIDPRWPGQIRMGLRIRQLVANNHDAAPIFATEWEDTSGDPILYYVVDDEIRSIQNGSNSQAGGGSLAATATGAMFEDDGSGIPYIYTCYGGASGGTKIQRMNRAGTLSQASDAVTADRMLAINGYAYRTIVPANGTQPCQITTISPGNERFTLSLWGAGVTVGFAGTPINSLLSLRQSPVAVKPEGIFVYNEALDRWVNYTPDWQGFMHPDNGKGSYSLGESVIVPLGDGGALIWDGFSAKPFDPISLNSRPGLHTTTGNLELIGSTRHWVVGTTKKCSKMISAGGSMRAFHYDNDSTTYTDIGANLRDGDIGTTITFTINETTDELLIGWVRPFTAIRLDMGSTVNSVSRTMTASISTGSGTWATVAHQDFTDVGGAPLAKDGDIVLTEDPVAVRAWIQASVNSVTLYWLRLRFNGALTASTILRSVQLQPWFPSVDDTDFPDEGLDRSGVYPHILFGRSETQESIWHDMGSLPEPDDIGAIAVSDIGGSNKNQFRSLVLVGRFSTWTLEQYSGDHPPNEVLPFTNARGFFEGSAILPGQGRVAKLIGLVLNGQEFDPATFRLQFYYTWDYGKPWSKAGSRILNVPANMDINSPAGQRGTLFRWGLGWRNSTANFPPGQPLVTQILASFELENEPVDSVQSRVMQTLPRF